MKYLTVIVWALSAAMGGWLAYDYHVGVVDGWKAKFEHQRTNADFWFWRADEQSYKYWSEYEHHEKTIAALGAAEDSYREIEAELSIAHDRNRLLTLENDHQASLVAELSPEPIVNPNPMTATAKLSIEGGGHGSATHIGNGYLITAGHVATDEGNTLTARFKNGDEHEAVTLWSSATYDVALLKIDGYTGAASNLDCRTPDISEPLGLYGNPLAMEFIKTNGIVAGEITDAYSSAWAEAVPVDAALAGGMSGGGAFDKDGDLVGINVGIPLQTLGFGDSTFTGISFIVPASTICNLMGRS